MREAGATEPWGISHLRDQRDAIRRRARGRSGGRGCLNVEAQRGRPRRVADSQIHAGREVLLPCAHMMRELQLHIPL